jgi:hypothetical protein
MKHWRRLIFALLILVSGLTLAPKIGLSSQKFGWQHHADVYPLNPSLP